MPKVDLNAISGGFASTDALNSNFEQIEDAFDNTLSRDGSTPNQMNGDLDMNHHRILNVLGDSGANLINRGNWAAGIVYSQNNIVSVPVGTSATYGGASYISLVDHTSAGTFDADIAKWQLLADRGEQGASGAGSGDVVGPGSSTTGNIAVFDNTSGDLLADSGASFANLVTDTELTTALSGKEDSLLTGATVDITGDNTTPKKFAGDQINGAITAAVDGLSGWELVDAFDVVSSTVVDIGDFDFTTYKSFKIITRGLGLTNAANVKIAFLYNSGTALQPEASHAYYVLGIAGLQSGVPSFLMYADITFNIDVGYSGNSIHASIAYGGRGASGIIGGHVHMYPTTLRTNYSGIRLYLSSWAFASTGRVSVFGLKE